MSLWSIIIVLVVVGVALYFFNRFVTMIDPGIKRVINVLVYIAIAIWLVLIFIPYLPDIRVGRRP